MDERELKQMLTDDEAYRRAAKAFVESLNPERAMRMSEDAKAMVADHNAKRAAAEEQALLDNFAKAALTGLLASGQIDVRDAIISSSGYAYEHAEAMLAERKRRMEARQQA